MHNIYLKDLINHTDGKIICGNLDTPLINFSKDTRTMNKGDIYIGIKGETFNGNNLYKEALEKGAIGCILDDDTLIDNELLSNYKDRFIVLTKDTIKCIQDLAIYKRSLYNIPVIGVTGSVGKTSTKDIIASVLSKKFNVLKTEGNYNNHIGVPLTILRLRDENSLVIEMGMNHAGEISVLSKIAKPTISVITNVGTAHIGNLGSRENILKAKLEILDGMDSNGILVINNDNDLLHEYYLKNGNNMNIITYGVDNSSNYIAKNIFSDEVSSRFTCNIDNEDIEFIINTPGNHFVLNALSAISIGIFFNIPVDKIKDGIANFNLTRKRLEIEKINDITIIKDFYNASLDSMTSAINYLGSLKGRKIAVLGDMLELGEYSKSLHEKVGEVLNNNNIDIVITVGDNSKYIKNIFKNEIYCFDKNIDAVNKLKSILNKNDYLLIKASFGMNFIEIYNAINDYLS